jgi:hypothetical protein
MDFPECADSIQVERSSFVGTGYVAEGHTGFTGTMVWVFLSNRVYPNATTNKLAEMGIRTKIQEVVHGAVAAREGGEGRGEAYGTDRALSGE